MRKTEDAGANQIFVAVSHVVQTRSNQLMHLAFCGCCCLVSNLFKMVKLPNYQSWRTYMLIFRRAFTFAASTLGASALLLLFQTSGIAHAPTKLPLPLPHLGHVPVSPIHAELEKTLINPSHLARIPISPVHAELEKALINPSHLERIPISPVNAELRNMLTASSVASARIPFDLRLLDYPEAEREKLTSIVVLLVQSEKHDQSGNFKLRDQISKIAREKLFSLSGKTILQVAKDEQFLRLHVLKHIFQIDS